MFRPIVRLPGRIATRIISRSREKQPENRSVYEHVNARRGKSAERLLTDSDLCRLGVAAAFFLNSDAQEAQDLCYDSHDTLTMPTSPRATDTLEYISRIVKSLSSAHSGSRVQPDPETRGPFLFFFLFRTMTMRRQCGRSLNSASRRVKFVVVVLGEREPWSARDSVPW